jgi:hypothetical protein
MSRSDPSRPVPPNERGTRTVPRPAHLWPTVLVWILLGAAIAAPWALLLFGDSLTATH